MSRIANTTRRYQSDLRAAQAEETRARILDAAVRLMARRPASTSIPAVAREAGVSVPTVYRHFSSKDELLSAIYPHIVHRAGIDRLPTPGSLDELRSGVAEVFGTLDAIDPEARVAMTSIAADEARRANMPGRYAAVRAMLESDVPELDAEHHDRIARLLVALTSSWTFRVWHDHLGVPVAQAADDVDWIVRAALRAAREDGPA